MSETAAAMPGAPTGSEERLISLDFIRGIAVLGILFANIAAFGQPMMGYIWPRALVGGMTEGDKLFWLIQFVLIDGKMRGLFTVLFGVGMMVFIERAWAKSGTRWLQLRRLAWLLLFGTLHFYFLWHGDILQGYAFSGMLALLAARWKPKTKLIVGLVVYLLGSLAFGVQMGGNYLASERPEIAAKLPKDAQKEIAEAPAKILQTTRERAETFGQGSYTDVVGHMFEHKVGGHIGETVFFSIIETVPLILIGMGLYGLGLFAGAFSPARQAFWGWVGVIGGTALTIPLGVWAYLENFPFFLTMFVFVGASPLPRLAVVLGLLALLPLWSPKATKTWLGERLVAAGRMAFSNYLGTSLVMAPIFYGWGLGWFGEFGRVGLFGFVLFGWALMLAWSKPWLERFRYGPLEWLWRCLTYWQLFPLRR